MKKKILVLNGQYAPGYKGGGPIQSCINMVENLYDRFDFYILCADRDCLCNTPYDNVEIDKWTTYGHANVYYMSPGKQCMAEFAALINGVEADLIYLNGFFSPIYTIRTLLMRKLGKIKAPKVILTPRGDFTGGCENKKLKKYSYIYVSKLLGLYNSLLWQATSQLEEQDIIKRFPNAKTVIVPNLAAKFTVKPLETTKNPGELKLVFVSRIFPKKNLKVAIESLKNICEGIIDFDIYGPMHDPEYWNECKAVIEELPENINVEYKGEAQHNQIPQIFSRYHAFLFPTLGENYGHVIVEAMMNNCLCILSKGTTPWDDYSECGDFICDLSDEESITQSIKRLLQMDMHEFKQAIDKNNDYISRKVDCSDTVEMYEKMFNDFLDNKV